MNPCFQGTVLCSLLKARLVLGEVEKRANTDPQLGRNHVLRDEAASGPLGVFRITEKFGQSDGGLFIRAPTGLLCPPTFSRALAAASLILPVDRSASFERPSVLAPADSSIRRSELKYSTSRGFSSSSASSPARACSSYVALAPRPVRIC